jgi:ArsR family transcriptional regulator
MSASPAPVLSPRERPPGGWRLVAAEPNLGANEAVELAALAKALGDPTRLRIIDALRTSAPGAICQCELTPLFEMSQQALSKHLKVLTAAGVLGSERRGLWTYYHVIPDALEEIAGWLNAST